MFQLSVLARLDCDDHVCHPFIFRLVHPTLQSLLERRVADQGLEEIRVLGEGSRDDGRWVDGELAPFRVSVVKPRTFETWAFTSVPWNWLAIIAAFLSDVLSGMQLASLFTFSRTSTSLANMSPTRLNSEKPGMIEPSARAAHFSPRSMPLGQPR